ncbi:hypothetical protein [Billgrantia montanilacus]|uniref:Uncharacterized protein n=1 Tax=Billgrantia montanilacus TaxID=2282305 RepID=A0A368U167_9GAMM|nr:hypothetical protein [Halomonas montanilacus]RCV88843.1 hypothetical protein DU505_12085 [Halomonas montanilacus]
MSSPKHPADDTPSAGQEPINDYLEGQRTLLELKCCAPKTLSVLIHDLSQPMSRSLEQALARSLAAGDIPGFQPTDTLMPAMMRALGLAREDLDQDPIIHALRTTCNSCSKVGTCWLALRYQAPREECRRFCPNAKALEARAADPDSRGPAN